MEAYYDREEEEQEERMRKVREEHEKKRKMREKAFRERLAKESEERRKDAAKWFGREMDYSTTQNYDFFCILQSQSMIND